MESLISDSSGTRKGRALVAATAGVAGGALGGDCFAGSLHATSEANPKLSTIFLGLRLPVIGYLVSVTALL
jgi:hypothetical protein